MTEVLNSISKTLAKRYTNAYWMKAEMNKLNYYSYSGHCYPELLEKKNGKVVAQARGIIWNSNFQQINKKFEAVLKEPLKDGITILLFARIVFSPVHGLSLQILDIDPSYSLGVLELEKLQAIQRLKEEQLFFKNKRIQFPLLPQRVAIVSVETSKGYADFLKIIQNNPKKYAFNLTLFPARLQGELAVVDIINQLTRIKKQAEHFDLVTIIRGGGGDVGLSSFNNYELAKAIAEHPLPVITGIGHATNETLSEMVAYRNAITPTECAQMLLTCFEEADNYRQQLSQQLIHHIQKGLQQSHYRYNNYKQLFLSAAQHHLTQQKLQQSFHLNHIKRSLKSYLNQTQINFVFQQQQLGKVTQYHLQETTKRWKTLAKTLQLIDPTNVLKRGFSITRFKGKSIHPGEALPLAGEEIETILYQGIIKSTVNHSNNSEKNNQDAPE